jgi:hypothetical protein
VDVAAAGSREVTVAYIPSSYYGPNSVLYTVPRLATTLNVFGATTRSFTYGDSQVFAGSVISATGTVPTGTVSLLDYLGTTIATATLSGGLFSITTTELPVRGDYAVLEYGGDASHLASDNRACLIRTMIAQASGKPVLAASPGLTIGANGSLTATMPNLGAGATGTVSVATTTGVNMGSAPIVNGVATIPLIPIEPVTFYIATYTGDHNFSGAMSDILRTDAARAPVTVTIEDPGPVNFGDVFTLTVKVKVGATGLRADHGIDFVSSTGGALASNVYVDLTGTASQVFCARSSGCPADTVVLGASDLDIIARYGESSINLLGEDSYEYRPSKPATTTTLVVTPSPTILVGSGVILEATVATATPGVTPTGTVSFYGVEVDGSLSFIKSVALTGGVATWTTAAGDGLTDLRWPQNKVKAIYSPDGALFQASQSEVAITLKRFGTSVTIDAGTPVYGQSAEVTVTLSHEPGTSADYRGSVTISTDFGTSCLRYLPAGQRTVTCSFTWLTPGPHPLSVYYSGDVIYADVMKDIDITVGTPGRVTPALHVTAPTSAIAGQDVTVGWSVTTGMTGTMTVYADGTEWCRIDIYALSCTGRFPNSSASATPKQIRVQYSGDTAFTFAEEIVPILVTRCAILDVRPNSAALGSVRVDTTPNCGTSGYLPGTTVQVTALPKSPAEFGYWLGYRPPAPNLVLVSSSATTRFTVTLDDQTWVRVAQFRMPCGPVTADVTGYGGISVYPATNCTTDGVPGYLYGTKVAIYPDELYNPSYDEPDAFYEFGPGLPEGAVPTTDSSNRPYLRLTVTGATTIPVSFGPVCRPVPVTFDPASEGDAVTYEPEVNCTSPLGDGFLRDTEVTAHAVPGDPTLAITGWTLNGAPAPELGTTSDPTVTIDQTVPELVATVVHCYIVDAKVDAVLDRFQELSGTVRIDGTACPDGSDRYLGGTEVTLTPQVLVAGSMFSGWDEQRIKALKPDTGETGDVSQGARVILLDRDIHTTAGFYDATACSPLTTDAAAGLVAFENTGCGPGFYFDARKQTAAAENVPVSSLTSQKYYSKLRTNITKTGPLNTYVSIKGDAPDCLGSTTNSQGYAYLGPKAGGFDCSVSGPISVAADVCQPVVTKPTFTVAGQPGTTYGAADMPTTFYLTGPDGVIRRTGDFQWGQSLPVVPVGKKYAVTTAYAGPCASAVNLFRPNTDVLLYAAAPSQGMLFLGWTDPAHPESKPDPETPVHKITNAKDVALTANASYLVSCAKVSFGEGIHIEGDAPRCPGTAEADNMFIFGTAIQVRADYWIGDRNIEKFTSGVASDQIYEDPATLDWIAYATVGTDTKVEALYQDKEDRINTELAKAGKLLVGFTAVIGPVILGMVFPPAGIYLAFLGTMAGISGLIPGGGNVQAFFDLVNPAKITACVARWGFGNPGHPGGGNYGSMISTGKTAATAVFTTKDVLVSNIGPLGVAGAAASIGYGLYDAGVGGANMAGPQSVEELEDVSTIQGCLCYEFRLVNGGDQTGEGSVKAP